jgi:hypothetical protein
VNRKPKPPHTSRTVLRLSDEAARRLAAHLGAAAVRLANALDGLLATADAIPEARTREAVRALQFEYQAEREAIHRRFMDEMRDEKAANAWLAFVAQLRADLASRLPAEPRLSSYWFDQLARCLWRLKQRHWTAADIDHWRAVDSAIRERRRIRQAAIEDLRKELYDECLIEKRRRLKATIARLEATMPRLPWGDLFGRRKPFEPVSLTARIIGGLTLATLRSAVSGRRLRQRTKLDDVAIDFIMARLDRCLGGDDLPDRKDIEKTLRGLSSR